VGHVPDCLDPLTVELGLLFHPACNEIRGDWPKGGQAAKWANLDEFVSGTPLAPFIKDCRDWALNVQTVDKGVYATVYSYAVR
jgi:hypothetical protein